MSHRINFEYEVETYSGSKQKIVYTTNEVALSDVLENFRDFLRGCGYSVEGDLVVVDHDFNDEEIED